CVFSGLSFSQDKIARLAPRRLVLETTGLAVGLATPHSLGEGGKLAMTSQPCLRQLGCPLWFTGRALIRDCRTWRRGRDFNPADFRFAKNTGKTSTLASKYSAVTRFRSVVNGSVL